MPRSAKKSTSLVKAARSTFGVPETTGQEAVSRTCSTKVGTWVMQGKKI